MTFNGRLAQSGIARAGFVRVRERFPIRSEDGQLTQGSGAWSSDGKGRANCQSGRRFRAPGADRVGMGTRSFKEVFKMAKATPISPLAPKTTPEIPPIDGVRFATGAAGIRYEGRTDVMLALFDEGTQRRGRVHPIEMPFGAGRLVPRACQGRQGPRAGRQFRQRQRLHRQDRPRRRDSFPPSSPRRRRAAPSGRFFSLRPASSASRSTPEIRRRAAPSSRRAPAPTPGSTPPARS